MIKGEWDYIRHNRLILISVLAIMFIPFLYCIFFLKSVWDPYGETGELPVAVVNQDQPVTYQGQKLNVGDQTVTNLKKNSQLGWKFVSAKTAADGLKHHKYYTVITLPKNFSANAATALDKHPKKMTFTYKTNGSANYIAQVMSEVGSDKLDSQIRAKVTKAYAQATFKQIYTVGQGMKKAAKGSAQLKDGTVTLTDGLNTYTTGVKTLNNGLQQMKTSVTPLATGIQKLSTGSATLTAGLSQYTAGVSKLNSNMPTLQAGASKLNSGTYSYVDGVYKLNSGLGQMSSKVGPLASGVTQLKSGSSDLTKGLKKLDANSSQLTGGAKQLANGLSDMQTLLTKLGPSLNTLSSLTSQPAKLQALNSMLTSLSSSGLIGMDAATSSALQAQLNSLQNMDLSSMEQLPTAVQAIGAQMAAVKAAQPSDDNPGGTNTSDVTSAAQAADDAVDKLKDVVGNKTSSEQEISDATAAVSTAVANEKDAATKGSSNTAGDATSNYVTEVNKLMAMVEGLNKQLSSVTSGLSGLITLQQSGIINKLSPLLTATSQFTPSDLTMLSSALSTLQANSALISSLGSSVGKINDAVTGANKLSTGLDTYTAGVNTALGGSKQLSSGLNTLNAKIPALTSGVAQLLDGSNTLAKKGSELTSGTSQLNSGIGQVASGVSQLNSKSGQLNSGASQISNGLSTLNSKVPALTSGVNQLADGSAKLDANSNKLMQGTNKLSKGSGTLAKSLKSGADQINAQPLTSKTADMFAAPTHLKHESYSYVPNYGHALAPYVLSVALYVGALVFNFAFPIRKVSMAGGSASGWYLSKLSIGAVEGLAMGIIEPSLMMLAGLSVDHPMQMILISVLFAEASMFIVMFLSMLLDNPGRFLAMVLLMLQLGGSGGTFPMEVTNHFYNVVHPFLPMTYSILGFREAITSGMTGMVGLATWVLILFTIGSIALLWPTMWWLQKKHLMGVSQLDDNQKLQEVEDPNTNSHS
ncbi:YhgE/Pip domain-containing protein [Levilactobacillus huananensis]|uniref:YhgE/Pip domain-containing protein n=1 Tax=Levilactobacillus huananensis TaxID=2486019 RepID=UPI000F76C640|nr:YhgE/Pip domain-containing protein [Levilactobacillus huananensis]